MSTRPSQVAEQASHFSLRSVFRSNDPEPQQHHAQPQQPQPYYAPPQPTHQQQPSQQQAPIRFDLGGASVGVPLLPLGAGTNGGAGAAPATGLKFTLPTMRGNEGGVPSHMSAGIMAGTTAAATAARGGGGGGGGGEEKKLQAGFLSGGFASASNPEIMRLKGLIDELHDKLKKSAERVATAEQSVARGNKALQTERATAHARIVALASEVKNAQHREASVRAELAAVPKMEDLDRAKFEMQARGAVKLQASFDEETARVKALETEIGQLSEKHEALVGEHAALRTQLDTATAELSVARRGAATEATAEATTTAVSEAAQVATTAAPVAAESDATALAAHEMEHARAMQELRFALENARMLRLKEEHVSTTQIEELDAKLVVARDAQRDAERKHAKLEAFQAAMGISADAAAGTAAAAAAAATATCRCGPHEYDDQEDDEDEDEDEVTTGGRGQGNAGGWPSTKYRRPSGRGRSNNTAAVPSPPVTSRQQAQFEQFNVLKQQAEESKKALETMRAAGKAVSVADMEQCEHDHALARRAFWCAENDQTGGAAPLIGCCVTGAAAPITKDDAACLKKIREELSTHMSINAYAKTVASTAASDCCGVDLDTVCAVTGRITVPRNTSEAPVGLKMRTRKYVSAVSGDIKARLLAQQSAWATRETGVAPAVVVATTA